MSQGITYETAKKLKDAGFPQYGNNREIDGGLVTLNASFGETYDVDVYVPTLSELIEACSYHFETLTAMAAASAPWCVNFDSNLEPETKGKTPEEAVSHLYLALHPNSKEEGT